MIPLLSQQEAKELDNWLMSPSGGAFTLQQLMELAGLTIALTIVKYYPNIKNIFIATGPGNNGGDGLVASRHLSTFNYSVTVYRPFLENPESDFFKSLITQTEASGAKIITHFEERNLRDHDLIIDCLFGKLDPKSRLVLFLGFGFKGILRPPFDDCVDKIIKSNLPIVSVDCPTGWTSETATKLQPEMLISLTAPKECAKYFKGSHHILGGRFIPRHLPKEFDKIFIIRDLYINDELIIEI